MRLDLTESHYPLIRALTLMIPTPLNFGCTVDMWIWELAFSLTGLSSGVNSTCPCTFCQSWHGTPWSQYAPQHNRHTNIRAQKWKKTLTWVIKLFHLPTYLLTGHNFHMECVAGDRRQFHKFDRCYFVKWYEFFERKKEIGLSVVTLNRLDKKQNMQYLAWKLV